MHQLTRLEREKLEREQTIISYARELFYTLGFEKTGMNVIAKKSEYTIRTIYRYFKNKDDLFFAVLCHDYRELLDLIKKVSSEEDDGYKKIARALKAYTDFSKINKNFTTFIIRANQIIKSANIVHIPYKQKYIEINSLLFNVLIDMYKEAQKDGSIRDDLNAVQLAIFSVLMMTGYLDMYFACQEDYENIFNLSQNDMLNFANNRLLEILK